MNKIVGAATGPMIKILALAMFLPVITGFDNQTPVPGPSTAPESVAPASQAVPPTAPGKTGDELHWRRGKEPEADGVGTLAAGAARAPADSTSGTIHSWETGAGKSYLIPALEVPGFLILLNAYDRVTYPNQTEDDKKVYSSTFSSTWDHLRKQDWVFDKDPFNVNQFAHPYQGATMYGLARSSGLGFWESLAYSNVGSFLWKMAGETDPPSINDMITTGNAGSLLGEALFRMAGLVLKENGAKPDLWHEAGAAILSPPTAFNRLAFGDRFKPVFPSQDPPGNRGTPTGAPWTTSTSRSAARPGRKTPSTTSFCAAFCTARITTPAMTTVASGGSTAATTTCRPPSSGSRPRPSRWARPPSTGWPPEWRCRDLYWEE
ncbi:MAG TPA: DUF3943 domain-containing protein [Geomonas sp.]